MVQLLPAAPGFEHIHRYVDPARQRVAAKLLPGQFYVTRCEAIVAVVGTGVALCLRERGLGLGGLGHVLESPDTADTGARVAAWRPHPMTALLESLLAAGAQPRRLEARLFGGARILDGSCAIGAYTVAAVRDALHQAEVPILEEELGGSFPRKIDFLPEDGRVRIKRLRDLRNDTILQRDRRYLAGLR